MRGTSCISPEIPRSEGSYYIFQRAMKFPLSEIKIPLFLPPQSPFQGLTKSV